MAERGDSSDGKLRMYQRTRSLIRGAGLYSERTLAPPTRRWSMQGALFSYPSWLQELIPRISGMRFYLFEY